MIRLLIDERLSPELTASAYARGKAATHVHHLGLTSAKDRALRPIIVSGYYTFVTNNRSDFLRLYRKLEVHAGLVIIVPAVKKPDQKRLLGVALDAVEARGFDVGNLLCEVHADGRVEFSTWAASPTA